jgi:hypothetical protein
MEVGDLIVIEAEKVGHGPRRGVIVGLRDPLIRVRWDSGDESTIVPSSGAMTVLARTRPPSAR